MPNILFHLYDYNVGNAWKFVFDHNVETFVFFSNCSILDILS